MTQNAAPNKNLFGNIPPDIAKMVEAEPQSVSADITHTPRIPITTTAATPVSLTGLSEAEILSRYRISRGTLSNWVKNALPHAVFPDKSYNAQEFDDYVARQGKLTKRANKKTASHIEVPKELFTYLTDFSWVEKFTAYVEQKGSRQTIDDLLCLMRQRAKQKIEQSDKSNKEPNDQSPAHTSTLLLELDTLVPTTELYAFSVAYQIALGAGQKSESGSYYTPKNIVTNSLAQIKTQSSVDMRTAKVLEPACGGGFFVVEYAQLYFDTFGQWPDKLLYINDIDKHAVEITRYTLNLLTAQSLTVFSSVLDGTQLPINGFIDIVITNPPYGLKSDYAGLETTESFSHFIHAGLDKYLKPGGALLYILPESFLFIGKHKEIRQWVLNQYALEEVVYYGQAFTGVMSHIVAILVSKPKLEGASTALTSPNAITATKVAKATITNSKPAWLTAQKTVLIEGTRTTEISQTSLMTGAYIVAKPASALIDLDLYYQVPHTTLATARFALGIVTGNNKAFLSTEKALAQKLQAKAIISGKEVDKGRLLTQSPKLHYLIKDLKECQQKPKDMGIFLEKKIIYRFISKDIITAVDATGAYTLNSANLLVLDKAMGLSAEYVSAILNSDTVNQIFKAKFNSPIKILKNQLSELPIFIFPEKQQREIEKNYIAGRHSDNNTLILQLVLAQIAHLKARKTK